MAQVSTLIGAEASIKTINAASQPMSALGRKQTFALHQPMSALPPIADICGALVHVRLVPIADIQHSLDQLVGALLDL